mmetsp:Transcript_10624/g.34900  ORF Transcript_10624/g.34900 Transcript_10624/m.34900 type:complete len:376 (+) Transcript_10624:3-1130(+)
MRGEASMGFSAIIFMSCMLLAAPVYFNPQPRPAALARHWNEMCDFLLGTPFAYTYEQTLDGGKVLVTKPKLAAASEAQAVTCYELHLLTLKKKHPRVQSVTDFLLRLLSIAVLLTMLSLLCSTLYTDILNILRFGVAGYWLVHAGLTLLWLVSGRPNAVALILLIWWSAMPLLIEMFVFNFSLTKLIPALLVFFIAINAAQTIGLLLADIILKFTTVPHRANLVTKRASDDLYAQLCELAYVLGATYHFHLFCGFVVAIVDGVVESALIVAEILLGLHSWMLLNSRLSGGVLGSIFTLHRTLSFASGLRVPMSQALAATKESSSGGNSASSGGNSAAEDPEAVGMRKKMAAQASLGPATKSFNNPLLTLSHGPES